MNGRVCGCFFTCMSVFAGVWKSLWVFLGVCEKGQLVERFDDGHPQLVLLELHSRGTAPPHAVVVPKLQEV